MAIDYNAGITSLDTGASDITYSGNQGPKSPDQERQMAFDDTPTFELRSLEELLDEFREDNNGRDPVSIDDLRRHFYIKYGPQGIAKIDQAVQQQAQQAQMQEGREGIQMASAADPMLQEEYDKYVFEMQEQGMQPMSFEEFRQQAVAGMAMGGRAGYANGQLVQPGPGRPGYAGPHDDWADTAKSYSPGRQDREGEGYYDSPEGQKQLADQRTRINKMRQEGEGIFADEPKDDSILKKTKDIILTPGQFVLNQISKRHTPYYIKHALEKYKKKMGYGKVPDWISGDPEEDDFIKQALIDIDLAKEGNLSTKEFEKYMPEWQLDIRYGRNKGDGPGDPALPYYPRDVHPGTGGITDATGTTTSDWDVASLDLPFDRSGPKHDFSSKYFYGADGGRPGYAGGGDVRQGYFLGKLVKKAGRALKKVAKSPLGKAALLYGLGSIGGSYGLTGKLFSKGMFNPMNMKAGLFGANNLMKGFENVSTAKMGGLFEKLGLTQGYGSFMPTALGGILGASALGGLYTASNEDEDENEMYNKWLAEKNKWLSGMGDWNVTPVSPLYQRSLMAADGGRIGYAEGGNDDEEDHRSAALSAMYRPGAQEGGLMDMGGMEKDYRNEGGFVPIGGQERADDVPARLSKNEFVFTADAVRNAGGGDIDKGAEIMENLMENLENGGKVSEESQGLEGARNMFATSQRLEGVL